MLLQGDLKGAEFAFKKATEAEPGYADAWLNTARALIQEGETDAAKPYIEKALQLNPSLGRIYYFRALIEKTEGRYDDALASLYRVEAQYPRDRVALNQIARILLLKRAIRQGASIIASGSATSTLKICKCTTPPCSAIKAWATLTKRIASRRYSSASKRMKPRKPLPLNAAWSSPEDNNERQPVHAHESLPLP